MSSNYDIFVRKDLSCPLCGTHYGISDMVNSSMVLDYSCTGRQFKGECPRCHTTIHLWALVDMSESEFMYYKNLVKHEWETVQSNAQMQAQSSAVMEAERQQQRLAYQRYSYYNPPSEAYKAQAYMDWNVPASVMRGMRFETTTQERPLRDSIVKKGKKNIFKSLDKRLYKPTFTAQLKQYD